MKRSILVFRVILPIISAALLILIWCFSVPTHASGKMHSYQSKSQLVSLQVTITVDPTETELQKEQLTQEIDKLQFENSQVNEYWTLLSPGITILLAIAAGIWSFYTWRTDKIDEQRKRDEERFQTAVAALGNQEMRTSAGAAITLHTFLQPEYKQFHHQILELSIANLRLRTYDPVTPEPPGSLDQALISIFKKAYPLVRDEQKKLATPFDPQSLNASGIQLDNAYLAGTDLREGWLPQAMLRKAHLRKAQLKDIHLREANLEEANLIEADLEEADLKEANLTRANLEGANLTRAHMEGARFMKAALLGTNFQWAHLSRANLEKTHLEGARMEGAKIIQANLSGANLEGIRLIGAVLEDANLEKANLRGAYLEQANLRKAKLQGANLEAANSLQDTDISGASGLSEEQISACYDKGAILDKSQLSIVQKLPGTFND